MGRKLSVKRLQRDQKEIRRWKSHSAITPGALMTLGLFFGKMAQVGEFSNLNWGLVLLPAFIGPAYSLVSLALKIMAVGVRDGFTTWARGPESNSYGISSLTVVIMVAGVLTMRGLVGWSWAVFALGLSVGLFVGIAVGVVLVQWMEKWITD